MINISINNELTQVPETCTVAEYLAQQAHLQGRQYAIAINGDFLPRTRYADTRLQAGDTVDIVSPIGGG